MVIMHPDQVVVFEQGQQLAAEQRVDLEITVEILPVVGRQVETVMKQGPEHPIGKIVIVMVEVLAVQIDGGQVDVAWLPTSRPRRGLLLIWLRTRITSEWELLA